MQSRCVKLKVGQRVRHWRTIRNLKQYEVAKLAGIEPARLCRIELMKTDPLADEIERIVAAALGITMAEFYGEIADDTEAKAS